MAQHTVMLVDDEEADIFLHSLTLRESGRVSDIVSYQEAREALVHLAEARSPIDVIFLDINMPVMNGFDFLEAYRTLEPKLQARHVVVMLTSSLRPADRKRAQSLGLVADFLHKPLTVEQTHHLFDTLFPEDDASAAG